VTPAEVASQIESAGLLAAATILRLDESLGTMTVRAAEAEALVVELRAENGRLQAALDECRSPTYASGTYGSGTYG
jgi:hypothetical protein